MNVQEAAQQLGVTPRRVRALITQGRLSARKVGRAWDIDGLPSERRSRRPLSPRSRAILARALHHRTLGDLRGQERARTASRIRLLREADDPARLLDDWWGGSADGEFNAGTNLVRHAIEGDSAYVKETLHRRLPEYLRDPRDLADLAASERAINGLSRRRLAASAGVPLGVVARIERGEPMSSPVPLRRVLRALGIEPTALPTLAAS